MAYDLLLKNENSSDSESQLIVPKLPLKDDAPNIRPLYGLNTKLSTTLILRQCELYIMPRIASRTSIYTNGNLDLDEWVVALDNKDEFWVNVIRSYYDANLRSDNFNAIEEKILAGIPAGLRGSIYFRVLHVKTTVDKQTYSSLMKNVEILKVEDSEMPLDIGNKETHEVLRVFEHCVKESAPVKLQEARHKTFKFIAHVAPLLQSSCELEDNDVLALLFRIFELHSRFHKDEFAYKGCRSLEDVANDQFLHIGKQGINMEQFFEHTFSLCLGWPTTESIKVMMLDLLVFEGFDSLLRLVVAQAISHKERILASNGDDLLTYLYGDFYASVDEGSFKMMTEVEFPLVKYENEFHLKTANSISSNDQEILNLREVFENLVTKRIHTIEKLISLRNTNQEILAQNDDYQIQLTDAQAKREQLIEEQAKLQSDYALLTMEENLENTVKANTDISNSNHELFDQILELEAMVGKKKAKLSKSSR